MAVSKNFPNPFGMLASRYRVLRQKLPRLASVIAAKHFTENFRRQGTLNNGVVVQWLPRKQRKGFKPGGGRSKNGRYLKKNKGQADAGRAILIKSGRLRRAIRPAATYDEARVINDAPYAEFHNEGTDKMPARPFMVTTPDLEDELEQLFFDEIDKLLK